MMTKNTASFGGGMYMDKSFGELLHPHEETQDPEEIIADVVTRAGITIT